MSDKIYVGNGKERETQYGKYLNVTLDLDDLISLYGSHGYVNKQGKRTVRIGLGRRKEVGQYGDTHTVTLDTWHPGNYIAPRPISVVEKKPEEFKDDGESDIPF